MLTVILILCVVLLVFEMMREGDSPFVLDDSAATTVRGEGPGVEAGATRDVTLYFADQERVLLARERRRIAHADSTVENCRIALQALLEGPRQTAAPTLAPGLRVRGLYLLPDGVLVIDFGREFEGAQPTGAATELLMVQSVVNTLIQPGLRAPDGVSPRAVRFLYEGSAAGEALAAHLDLSADITPDRSLLPIAAGTTPGD
jgi:hypothetical protein